MSSMTLIYTVRRRHTFIYLFTIHQWKWIWMCDCVCIFYLFEYRVSFEWTRFDTVRARAQYAFYCGNDFTVKQITTYYGKVLRTRKIESYTRTKEKKTAKIVLFSNWNDSTDILVMMMTACCCIYIVHVISKSIDFNEWVFLFLNLLEQMTQKNPRTFFVSITLCWGHSQWCGVMR